MENNYIVYMHKLRADSRKYIGITCKNNPNYRWQYGKGYKHNAYFWNTIEKYGWNAFEHIILFEGLTKNQACLKEQALIKLFCTTEHSLGFNLTPGGEHYEATEEVKKKISLKTKEAMQKLSTEKKIQIKRKQKGKTPWNKKEIPSREDLLINFYKCNNSILACADLYGVSWSLMYNWLVVLKIHKPNKGNLKLYRKLSDQELLDLRHYYIDLWASEDSLCKQFGFSKNELRFYLAFYKIFRDSSYMIKQSKDGMKVVKKNANKWERYNTIDILADELHYQYVTLNKTQEQCANYFDCSISTIQKYLKKYKIKKNKIIRRKKTAIDKEELYRCYVKLNYTVAQCANYFNTTVGIIKHRLMEYGIRKTL